jgi:hypothetical protein
MRRVLVALMVLAAGLGGADKKKAPKPPDLEVVEAKATRTADSITLDGRVRNTSEKPIAGLVLIFDLIAPGGSVIATQKGPAEDDVVEPGNETTFRVETRDEPRAVQFQVGGEDGTGKELRVVKQGPFSID